MKRSPIDNILQNKYQGLNTHETCEGRTTASRVIYKANISIRLKACLRIGSLLDEDKYEVKKYATSYVTEIIRKRTSICVNNKVFVT